ncbi:MAG: aminotransferase class I/II-fold pyridoxal phosphate-dependent enzyme [Myxococcales bacterium]|nr:aminotransferase class I/II-fold pyridoxal phosphate-dependent enzyme [Myxococcales bacterium]
MHATSFDATHGPEQLALAVLASADPLQLLGGWAQAAPQGELAKVLHLVFARLVGGEKHAAMSAFASEIRLGERVAPLRLLLIPSVFAPEAWGTTFLEGLLRKSMREYRGKRMIELGVGSGWISLVLLRLTQLSQIIGVDLNPQAVQIARLNALLNGYHEDGSPQADRLYDRFSATTSDLLTELRAQKRRADFVIGCIPQVIASSADTDSQQGLYDLSNYAIAQGLVEDAFGLGLNARALRDALTVLDPGGQVILNLASRPGEAVLSRMFERRGYHHDVLWRARIEQAEDTDIAPLVELERRAGQPFSFYLHRHSRESISAALASLARTAKLPIYHELFVVEGRPQSEALLPLALALESLRLSDLWERVDLSRATDEQLRFVTVLAERFVHDPVAPYPHEHGDLGFRQRVTGFLAKFHGVSLAASEVFVGPSRASLVFGALVAMVAPGDRVAVSHQLRPALAAALAKHGAEVVWVHDDAAELAELLPVLLPRLLIVAPTGATRHAADTWGRLLAQCQAHDVLLVLDDSGSFAITARPGENPMLAFLAEHPASAHLAVMIGLIHSQAFPEVELALLLCRHHALLSALGLTAEVTYSRISVFHQAYYESLFDELLTFRVGAGWTSSVAGPSPRPGPRLMPQLAQIAKLPVFARPEPAPDVLRLDYGENALPMPKSLVAGILEGFLLPPHTAGSALHARDAALRYLQSTSLPELTPEQVVLGQGVTPLLFDALLAETRRRGRPLRVGIARVGWPVVPAMLHALGATLCYLDVTAPGFQLDEASLPADLDVLIVANPGNPSGQACEPAALTRLIARAAQHGARVILDEIFGQLAELGRPDGRREDRLGGLDAAQRQSVLVLAGLSKEFAAGGLRVGFAASADTAWIAAIEALRLDPMPLHVQVATQAVLSRHLQDRGELRHMRATLRQRRDLLADGLARLGYGVNKADTGGLFLLVEPPAEIADAEAFVLEREATARVRFNTPSWSGATRHFRACFSLPEAVLREALARLATPRKDGGV